MTTSLVWKARPIFISSTFRDMHPERDFLRERAFRQLGERLRERCHHLDTIDLRQGVENASEADEAKREMQVLKVCLDEIERSKPFLVALLGDRYGWVPPAGRMAAAAREAGMPAGVDVEGRSVTELEILYGVLENPGQRRRSWFYFRTLDRPGMPPEIATRFPAEEASDDPASPAGRLRALKDRIRREMPGRVREYTLRWDAAAGALAGLDDLDAMVARDLWDDLDAETADYLRQAPKTWQEADARSVADFVAERTRGYVERPAVTDPMLALARSPSVPGAEWGYVVTGESGGGKSSIFGRVFEALQPRAEAGEIVLLAHAAGIFPMSGQVDRMLRRWVSELAASLGVPDPLEVDGPAAGLEGRATASPDWDAQRPRIARPSTGGVGGEAPPVTSEQIDETFASLLGQAAAQRRVVVLVDALNQFESTVRAQYVTWLPKLWPENARFLATAIPGTASAALGGRQGCRELPVPPITDAEAREIARRFYRERYHRDANRRVLDALLDKALPDGRPARGNPLWLALTLQEMNLLEADDFERADREFARLSGAERMQALQFAEAAKLPADVPGVYGELLTRAERGFGKAWSDAFVDLIAVSRAGWRESDLRELMPKVSGRPWDDLAFAGVRRALGTHVVQRGAQAQWDFFHAALRATVLQRNLADESARRRLHGLIADHLLLLPANDPLRVTETMVHLLGLGDRDRAAWYIAGLQPMQWSFPHSKAALAGAVAVLVEAIRTAADDVRRDCLTAWIGDLLVCGDDQRTGRVANLVVFDFNDALQVTGEARTEVPRGRLLRAAQVALARLVATDPSNGGWQRDLSVSQEKIGELLRAQGDLAGALNAYLNALDSRSRLASMNPSNLDWQRDLASAHCFIGVALQAKGDLVGALQAYREYQTGMERLAAADPSNAVWQGDLASAHCLVGAVLQAQGDLAGALGAYREYQDGMGRLATADPSNARWQRDLSVSHNKIGGVLHAQGDRAGALRSYRGALTVAERLAAADPSNAGWQRDLASARCCVGIALQTQGDVAGALTAYRESLSVTARLAAVDPSNASWQRDLSTSHARIGDVLLEQGDLAGALKAHRESMAVTARLAASDPSNASWQFDLASAHSFLGVILQAQGDLVGAGNACLDAHAILVRLTTADPANAVWQRGLFANCLCLATISEMARQDDAKTWWRKAYEHLVDMRQRGIIRPTDEKYLSVLQQKMKG